MTDLLGGDMALIMAHHTVSAHPTCLNFTEFPFAFFPYTMFPAASASLPAPHSLLSVVAPVWGTNHMIALVWQGGSYANGCNSSSFSPEYQRSCCYHWYCREEVEQKRLQWGG